MKTVCISLILIAGICRAQSDYSISNSGPSWSPDGEKIAYWSSQDGNNEIYVMNKDGSGATRITDNPLPDYLPKFSPDGSRLVFMRGERDHYQVYIVDLNSGEEKLVTGDLANCEDPAWLHDNSGIIFNADHTGNHELYIRRFDGSPDQQLTDNSYRDFTASISNDGRSVVFVRSEARGESNLMTMKIDGSNQKTLPHTFKGYAPVWSPNRAKIYFLQRVGSYNNIFQLELATEAAKELTNAPAHDIFPAISPDGKQLLFASRRDTGEYEIYLISLADGDISRLTHNSRVGK